MEELNLVTTVEMTPTELQYWNKVKKNVNDYAINYITISVKDLEETYKLNNKDVPSQNILKKALVKYKDLYKNNFERDQIIFKIMEVATILESK